jgi:predicted acyltransferase
LGRTHVGELSTSGWLFAQFSKRLADPQLASLAMALTTVAFWWLILWAMSRRGWSVRV